MSASGAAQTNATGKAIRIGWVGWPLMLTALRMSGPSIGRTPCKSNAKLWRVGGGGPGHRLDRDRGDGGAVIEVDVGHRVVRVVVAGAVDVVVLHEEHDRHAGVGEDLAVGVVERAVRLR